MMKILDVLMSLQIEESYVETTKKKVIVDGKVKTITEKNKKTRRVFVKDHRRKTCIIGFYTTIHSIFALAEELFEEGETILYTFLLLQDYLEQFFGIIRQHGGWNDNPTAVQIKYAMRKMLAVKFGVFSPSLRMNCSTLHVELEIEEDDDLQINTYNMAMEWAEDLDETEFPLVQEKPGVENLIMRNLAYIGGKSKNSVINI